MAVLSDPLVLDTLAVSSAHEGRKHLQRLIRKVKLVLIVKHCLDDIRKSVILRQSQDAFSETSINTLIKNSNDVAIIPVLDSDLEHTANKIYSDIGRSNLRSHVRDEPSVSRWKQSLNAFGFSEGWKGFESRLDAFISRAYDFTRKRKLDNFDSSHEIWISWAKKRGSSVYDIRALSVLVKSLRKDGYEGEQLRNLLAYLEAYTADWYGRTLERVSEVVSRLRAVFGVGWFFEWPSGRHPLNSTWPWADVKPSLLVLWGVCWMFYDRPHRPPQRLPPHHSTLPLFVNGPFRPISTMAPSAPLDYLIQQPLMAADPQFDERSLPARQQAAALVGSIRSRNSGPPCSFRPIRLGYTGTTGTFSSHNSGAPSINSTHLSAVQSYGHSHYGQPDDWEQHIRNQGPNANYRPFTSDVSLVGQYKRAVAEHDSRSPEASEPYWSGENSSVIQAATRKDIVTNTIHNPLLPHFQPVTYYTAHMPSQNPFSYPSLDNMDQIHTSQPYMVDPDRAFNPMPEPHEYDQHQDPPRYPTPPLPPSDNPYNAQPGGAEPAVGRIDLPMEPKSDSDAPSPERSKPIPKPDREVTKDANGRFYCNWPGCTEEIKDFGRKCEWSKHMDKHDRPYKCPAEGCEKLPGFTYSGGLLRHEREVHNKHGGPRKQLNCPHLNCKRHTGKGFSRQENLNEHLRRVHTDTGLPMNGEDTEDDGNEEQAGGKRKRNRGDSADIREEMKRLKQENEELRRQTEAQNVQVSEMMRQILQLQQAQQLQSAIQHPRLQAPPAQMT